MISGKWQRRIPKHLDIDPSVGVVARIGGRLSSVFSGLMFQSITPSLQALPEQRNDKGPFGRLGPNTAQAVKRVTSALGRTVSAPFGALVTVTIADGFVRVLTARGNRVRAWAESELPIGVVQHGLIVDEQTFIEVLGGVIKEVTRNGKLNGQKVAIAITGRNMVQRRLAVYVEDESELVETIIEASSESMSIRTDEMHIEWNAEALDMVDEDELDELEDESIDSDLPDIESDSTHEVKDCLKLETLDININGEPDGDPYDVYALALHKHVIRRNLRTVSEFSTRFAGVQPKILALAAAVNSRAGVILDIEESTLITAVVSNGLPEVIREVGLAQNMSELEWENLITTQISRGLAFYESIFPEDLLGDDVEVFLTGEIERAEQALGKALQNLPYVRAAIPQTLRASEEFSFEKYAANVGLVIVSGKRFWQRAPVHLLSTPKFDFRPSQYRPRPLPIGAALKVAAALILGFGVFTSYQIYTTQTDSVEQTSRNVELLEIRTELRALKLDETRQARVLLDANKAKTERLIAANNVLEDRGGGFGDTVSIITAVAPSEVHVTSVDDDGQIVAVSAASGDYPEMFEYIRLLENVLQFEHVQVLSITRRSASVASEGEPVQRPEGSPAIDMQVEASLVITRVEIDNSQIIDGEELAAAVESS